MNNIQKYLGFVTCLIAFTLSGCNTPSGEAPGSSGAIDTVAAEPSPRARMGLKYAPGQTLHMQYRMISDMLLPIGIRDADHKETRVRCRLDVQPHEPGAAVPVHVTIERIRAEMKSLSKFYDYDSAADDDIDYSSAEAQKLERFRNVFSPLVGATYDVLVQPGGASAELTRRDAVFDAISRGTVAGTFGKDQAVMVFAEHNLRDVVCLALFEPIAGELIEPNRTWTSIEPIRVPLAPQHWTEKTCTLNAISDDNIARLTFTISEPDPDDPQTANLPASSARDADLEIVGIDGKGKLRLDLTKGSLIQFEEQSRAQVRTVRHRPVNKDNPNKIYYFVRRFIEPVQPDEN